MNKLTFEFHYRPGKNWLDEELIAYRKEIRDVAETCFDEIPEYQIFVANRKELKNFLVIFVRNEASELIGFASSVILDIKNTKNVLHLGLTCVKPEYRGKALTHKLISQLIIYFYIRHCFLQPFWITNVACVLSSLANVATNFDDVFPAPNDDSTRSDKHDLIAQEINQKYRELMAINESAAFDKENYIFRGSVQGTVFAKEATDSRYHHRRHELNQFYQNLINFQNGDEVLQIGRVSMKTIVRYVKTYFNRLMNLKPQLKYE
ncbi:MAG: GNAT family N-acetyltransferase [Bacteriovoracaceae bacterium]